MNMNKNIYNPAAVRGAAVAKKARSRGFSAPSAFSYPYLLYPTPPFGGTPLEVLGELAASRAASKAAGRKVSLSSLQQEYARELTSLVSSLVRR